MFTVLELDLLHKSNPGSCWPSKLYQASRAQASPVDRSGNRCHSPPAKTPKPSFGWARDPPNPRPPWGEWKTAQQSIIDFQLRIWDMSEKCGINMYKPIALCFPSCVNTNLKNEALVNLPLEAFDRYQTFPVLDVAINTQFHSQPVHRHLTSNGYKMFGPKTSNKCFQVQEAT